MKVHQLDDQKNQLVGRQKEEMEFEVQVDANWTSWLLTWGQGGWLKSEGM